MLRVTLEDDGLGVGDGAPMREGIGLRNTRARLHHLYGRGAIGASSAPRAWQRPERAWRARRDSDSLSGRRRE